VVSEHSAARAWSALLVVWTGLFLAAASQVEKGESALLLPVLAALVGVLGLSRLTPRLGPVAGLAATAVFVGVRVLVEGASGLAVPGSVAFVGLLGIGLLAEALGLQADRDTVRARHDARLIEELTPIQRGTGVLKWQHAARDLEAELISARRYRYPVSLVVWSVDDWDHAAEHWGGGGIEQLADEMARLLIEQIRTTDRISYRGNGEFVLILTHTGLSGALAVVDKCRLKLKQDTGLDERAGVAEFPSDGGTAEELLREAEAALEFARSSGLRVASRELLGG
jgi:diguanylate cyclase (GGDEF)-like protein